MAAGAPPKGSASTVTAKVQWRVAASGNEATGWTDARLDRRPDWAGDGHPSGTSPATYAGVCDLTTATHEAAAAGPARSRGGAGRL